MNGISRITRKYLVASKFPEPNFPFRIHHLSLAILARYAILSFLFSCALLFFGGSFQASHRLSLVNLGLSALINLFPVGHANIPSVLSHAHTHTQTVRIPQQREGGSNLDRKKKKSQTTNTVIVYHVSNILASSFRCATAFLISRPLEMSRIVEIKPICSAQDHQSGSRSSIIRGNIGSYFRILIRGVGVKTLVTANKPVRQGVACMCLAYLLGSLCGANLPQDFVTGLTQDSLQLVSSPSAA